MILKKIVTIVAAVAAIAAAAAVCVVALAFALYAVARDYLGPAWGAAAVAGAAALIVLILALMLALKAKPPKAGRTAEPQSLMAKAMDLAKERPLVALAAAGAVVAVMIRNPKILGPILAAAFASRTAAPPPPRKR